MLKLVRTAVCLVVFVASVGSRRTLADFVYVIACPGLGLAMISQAPVATLWACSLVEFGCS